MIEPNSVCNEIVGSHDWLPTFLTAAGEPGIVDKLKKGYGANGKTYKVQIDGYDLTPYLSGAAEKHEREHFFYFSDDGGRILGWSDGTMPAFEEAVQSLDIIQLQTCER